ncbi:CENPBD1 [Cordylochernes scorpioides]|uniref:CENPBD1 n=1 Tax=Cordylochernes scorpioides TaxID=51811 RepID=A0ABY6L198_9ARAC|nr:CENPBD1 [Cordylochernes scorpioides]
MDQGVISTFKSYYLRRTFKLLLSETDGQDKPTMLEVWKKFSIMKAIKIISDSWEEVKPSCMNGVWRKIWPECVHRSAAGVDGTPAVRHEISNLARESNFEGRN